MSRSNRQSEIISRLCDTLIEYIKLESVYPGRNDDPLPGGPNVPYGVPTDDFKRPNIYDFEKLLYPFLFRLEQDGRIIATEHFIRINPSYRTKVTDRKQ